MNYRHAFHAGNFADVVKHAVLTRILIHLAAKPTAYRVIDTHAGAGLYDLTGAQASRTGEWRDGIARLAAAQLTPPAEALLSLYLDTVASFNRGGSLTTYPGSPALTRALLRPRDRLLVCELEPDTALALAENLRGDARVKIVAIDGWTALKAYVPPKERRGLVLVDPAFEQPDEFARLADGLAAAHRKWPTGIYLLWYPIKERKQPYLFARRLAGTGTPSILRAEFEVAAPDADRLNACGLVVVNPPWLLERELAVLLPALASCLARDPGSGAARLDWLAREK
jgi:23S rRNA (adenine2030-N6)-methyltransferase